MSGKFVWYDLLTTDTEAAIAFYTEVIGWGTEASQGQMPYTMFTAQGAALGGVMPLPTEAVGAPPHWIGYVGVDDIEARTQRVKALGGVVHRPVDDIPGVGRFSVVADPQGAVFALFQPKPGDEAPSLARNAPGAMSWAELNTTDWESAWRFYASLFGWENTSAMDLGRDLGTYFMFKAEGEPGDASMGGMSNVATAMGVPPHWLFYANVPSIEPALARVREKGGKVMNGPMPVPGGGIVAQCADPQGGYFALYAE